MGSRGQIILGRKEWEATRRSGAAAKLNNLFHLPQSLLGASLLVFDGDLVVPVAVYHGEGLLAQL